jgi:hypothetical protein
MILYVHQNKPHIFPWYLYIHTSLRLISRIFLSVGIFDCFYSNNKNPRPRGQHLPKIPYITGWYLKQIFDTHTVRYTTENCRSVFHEDLGGYILVQIWELLCFKLKREKVKLKKSYRQSLVLWTSCKLWNFLQKGLLSSTRVLQKNEENGSYKKKLFICKFGSVHFLYIIVPKSLRNLQERVQRFHEVQD